jgi:uncharacterized zinc-type alcohol dehydrogenase-like protein
MRINAHAAMKQGGRLEPYAFESGPLGPYELLVKVECCGLCHTDAHHILGEYYAAKFPFVPGHEIVGKVQEVGSMVDKARIGRRVGVGYQYNSCLECEWCIRGKEHLCKQKKTTLGAGHGGFADFAVADARFAFAIPSGLKSEHAAPLLCAGLTVYDGMRDNGAEPESRVGVLGLGGLGHIAVMFAHAMGCKVTVLSSSPDKEAEAKRMGATNLVNTRDEKAMKEAAESVDLLVCTSTKAPPLEKLMPLVRPLGRIVLLSRTAATQQFQADPLLGLKRSIAGSITGGRSDMNQMLEFAARNHVEPLVELMPMAQCNEALERLLANKARYRIVLQNPR